MPLWIGDQEDGLNGEKQDALSFKESYRSYGQVGCESQKIGLVNEHIQALLLLKGQGKGDPNQTTMAII